MGHVLQGDFRESFLHNPSWVIWIVFQLGLVYLGTASIIRGSQVVLPVKIVIVLAVVFILTWIFKFIAGPEYF